MYSLESSHCSMSGIKMQYIARSGMVGAADGATCFDNLLKDKISAWANFVFQSLKCFLCKKAILQMRQRSLNKHCFLGMLYINIIKLVG